jgi:dTDP-4-dehydrorhamnose reductase
MLRVLITGASGMLGSNLANIWKSSFHIFCTGRRPRPEHLPFPYKPFDLSKGNPEPLLSWSSPDVIVHCAALTDVDYCEEHPEVANRVNSEVVKHLTNGAPNTKFVFISTDAVLPINGHMPDEDVIPGPFNAYGLSKLYGEQATAISSKDSLIIRTTPVGRALFGTPSGFVDWIYSSLKQGEKVDLFHDVLFSPITPRQLAEVIEQFVVQGISGLWHAGCRNPVSKYDFGKQLITHLGRDLNQLGSISISDRKFLARRSKDQSLSCSKLERKLGVLLPTPRQVVEDIVNAMGVTGE